MLQAGAESLDQARENWWVGLRNAEVGVIRSRAETLRADEPHYRRGFESALYPDSRGKSYEDAQDYLRECHGDVCEQGSFRRGYERGHAYYQGLREKHKS